jgi:hypothetical protein
MADVHMVALKVPRATMKKLEDFRFENRFDTKTAAMLYLWEWALAHGATAPPPEERKQRSA